MAVRVLDVIKSYDGEPVLSGFSADLPERGLVAVTGPSGAGKSTLLRLLAGLEQPDSGSIEGVPDTVSMQFEDDRLFPWMDALANVVLVGCDEVQARALFAELGLSGKEHARIGDLSGGQRRRVALARALAYPAPLRLLDEPTARLDAESAALVMNAVERRRDEGLTFIATHDALAAERCDSVIDIS